jgi:hypothetical protein
MSGSGILSDDERREMLEDALDERRRAAFRAARELSQSGTLDDYIEFLSQHRGLVPFRPRRPITDDFRL